MTTKAYLGQARFLDMRIKSKIQQIDSLRELATSCTAVLSDMPRNPNHGASKVESCVMKIIEVQEGLQDDINAFLIFLVCDLLHAATSIKQKQPGLTRPAKCTLLPKMYPLGRTAEE